jgi:hypothetical protein
MPEEHVPPRQSWPQRPQLVASLVTSTHVLPHSVSDPHVHVFVALHVNVEGHPPQSCDAPHVSRIEPHLPVQSQLGVQPQMPDAPHVSGAVHVPQWSVPPQPSGQSLQFFAPHVVAVHPQMPVVPPPPHV